MERDTFGGTIQLIWQKNAFLLGSAFFSSSNYSNGQIDWCGSECESEINKFFYYSVPICFYKVGGRWMLSFVFFIYLKMFFSDQLIRYRVNVATDSHDSPLNIINK